MAWEAAAEQEQEQKAGTDSMDGRTNQSTLQHSKIPNYREKTNVLKIRSIP